MTNGYSEFTPEIVTKWEETLKERPDCEWNENKIADILPLIKKVGNLRIGKNQSLFGLSIISIENYSKNEEKLVRESLEPLVNAGLLAKDDVEHVVEWYAQTKPSWDSGYQKNFSKEFTVDGITYELITDNYRNYRDLNLRKKQ